jgi:hypothetical protein
MLSQTLEVPVRGACRHEVPSQPGVHRSSTGRVQEGLILNEHSEQVEELPLTLVEMLSRDHGATPLGSRLFREGLRVVFFLLNEHAGHRFAAAAVVVNEATGGTSNFPCANRNRSGSGVGCGSVEAFDGKAGATFVAQEPVVPARGSHGRSFSAAPHMCRPSSRFHNALVSVHPLVGERRQAKDDHDNARGDGDCRFPQSWRTTVSSEWLTLSPSV